MDPRTILREGTVLHSLVRRGSGAPVLVLPGVMADAEAFVPVVDAFAHSGPVYVLDRRGRTPSGPLGDDYSVDVEVEDLRAWLDHVGAEATLVGWSYGATIALETAARDERVRSVVAYEPVLAPFAVDVLPVLERATPDRRVEIINLDISRQPREHVDALRATPVWESLCRLAEPAARELAALNGFVPHPAWSTLAADLVVGERSVGTVPYGESFQRAAGGLPRSTTTVLPGQGHLAHVEDPGALGRLLSELVSR